MLEFIRLNWGEGARLPPVAGVALSVEGADTAGEADAGTGVSGRLSRTVFSEREDDRLDSVSFSLSPTLSNALAIFSFDSLISSFNWNSGWGVPEWNQVSGSVGRSGAEQAGQRSAHSVFLLRDADAPYRGAPLWRGVATVQSQEYLRAKLLPHIIFRKAASPCR